MTLIKHQDSPMTFVYFIFTNNGNKSEKKKIKFVKDITNY